MSRVIATIEHCDIYLEDDGRVHFIAKAAIDDDGSDNRENDPDWQPNTSLCLNGKPVDAESVPYIVVPPAIVLGVPRVVLGCRAQITFRGETLQGVVADIGPHEKLGEISPEYARRIGIPSSPRTGGIEAHVVLYELWPGVPAIVDGVAFNLQPWRLRQK